jgi:plasmid stability protein
MATLYAENVPEERYQALREQARRNHRSIAGEVIELLREHVPTRKEMAARQETIRRLRRIGNGAVGKSRSRSFPASEQMQREDRRR